ncbi:hypothetical protein GGH91_002754 [Coemansia sp. RSA 2671]|nr:hypothetical protein LPJ60_002918 [Coemansia sp. RSA 2675]KAJ2344762.1 hypothetical protein GGH91_002754 [Coemansia sp. RSA 2671]
MYEVRAGDYCYKIAVVNGISYQQFLAQNPGIDCTRLRIGQSVCLIPLTISGNWGKGLYSGDAEGAATNEEESAGLMASTQCQAYTVQPGDVCSQIAENNDISVTKLVELNQSVPSWSGCSSLQVGQKVCIA